MANRVEIPIVVLEDASPTSPVSGASAVVKIRGGVEATVYSDSGTTNNTITQPLTTDEAGRLTGWLPRGAYEVIITIPGKNPYTEFLDIAPGSDGAIEATWIGTEAVETSKIKKEAVTEPKIGPLAVSASKIAKEAVETEKIKGEGVTTAKLANAATTSAKLSSELKGGVEDNKVRIHGPVVRVQRTTLQNVTNEVWTAVSFDNSEFDTDAAWSAGTPTKLIAPIDGIYIATGLFVWHFSESGYRVIAVFKETVELGEVLGELSDKGAPAVLTGDKGGNGMVLTTVPFKLKAGEGVVLGAWQSSGGTLELLAGDGIHHIKFGMHWVRPF